MTNTAQSDQDARFLRDLRRFLRPASLYVGMTQKLECDPPSHGRWRFIQEFGLARTSGSATPEETSQMHSKANQLWALLEADPESRAMVSRLNALGLTVESAGQGDACGAFRLVRVEANAERFNELRQAAEYDAGFKTSQARWEADQRLKRWLRQNFHPDWARYREVEPLETENPFAAHLSRQ